MRLSTDERRHIQSWLEIARSAYERRSPFCYTLNFAQAPDLVARALSESEEPTIRVSTVTVTCRLVHFGGNWVQWVASDPMSGEPIVFGDIHESPRFADERHREIVARFERSHRHP